MASRASWLALLLLAAAAGPRPGLTAAPRAHLGPRGWLRDAAPGAAAPTTTLPPLYPSPPPPPPPASQQSPAAPAPRRRRPVVIAHRGASGALPEHTAAAYEAAIAAGADFIECDVQLTADLHMICRHEQNLNETTDALEVFPGRARALWIDGEPSRGVHAADLTLAELRRLRARQRFAFRDQSHNGRYPLVTFEEFLDIADAAPRGVGVYPELKHPAWHNALPQMRAAGATLEAMVVAALHARGYGAAAPANSGGGGGGDGGSLLSSGGGGGGGDGSSGGRPAFIQSFELSSLRRAAALTRIPLVLLLGGWPGYVAPDSGLTHAEMTTPDFLADAAAVVAGAGPWKGSLWAAKEPVGGGGGEGGGSGSSSGGEEDGGSSGGGEEGSSVGASASVGGASAAAGLSPDAAHDASLPAAAGLASSSLASRLRAAGLLVHPYTLRDEPSFVPAAFGGDVRGELSALFESEGVDGVFADYPGTAVAWLEARAAAAEAAAAYEAAAPEAEGGAFEAEGRAAAAAGAAARNGSGAGSGAGAAGPARAAAASVAGWDAAGAAAAAPRPAVGWGRPLFLDFSATEPEF
ncbi:hypothetical protein Rsub_02305 [Raphidocelis subcapitata]|uniref:glycerophosphodiester phosphodiesterase n=1 Tax=Raphidocelis subcapitata TaxID=307507 RepID=A0A2V0NXD7_9CHLO|nr:hypothetical protein Rsub_02305 [Raphidocelis subcapitata]|eukprot:GBF89587.1 hypothetical protein Rsub_02305 [Raphidocelis subcapitata]